MFKKITACTLAILVSACLLLAHGNATHLMGTVTAVGNDSVTIKDKDGKSIVVTLEKTTKYFRNKKPATAGDLKIGSRVVIDAQMDQKKKTFTAEEIQLGTTEATAKQ
jgi:hypothetical protein